MKTLVLGLGNPLRRDDGIGLQVVRRVASTLDHRENVDVEEDHRGGLRLMERLVGYDRAIIVDAILSGAPPGTVHRLSPSSIPTRNSACAHDVDLPMALALGRQAGGKLPRDENILLLAIEAADVDTFGDTYTEAVLAAVPQAADAVIAALGKAGQSP